MKRTFVSAVTAAMVLASGAAFGAAQLDYHYIHCSSKPAKVTNINFKSAHHQVYASKEACLEAVNGHVEDSDHAAFCVKGLPYDLSVDKIVRRTDVARSQ